MTEQETSHIEYWVMGFNHGINQERDRIIELLTTSQEVTHDNIWKWCGSEYAINLGNLITLIKEGNK